MKIALLAMSGVRAHDKKLLELGLTLPSFVDRSKVIASLPSLGLLYLAAVTPKEFEVCYFESEDIKEFDLLKTFHQFDLVAISTMTAQANEAYDIADLLKQSGKYIVMGGLHASVEPREALQHSDSVIVGECENVWPKLLEAILRNEGKGIWNAHEFPIVDVNTLPCPSYSLLKTDKYNRFTVQTSRGCPWRCEFCASSVMLSQKYRKRSVDNIIRDIKNLMQYHNKPYIEFADDNTFVDKNWGKELCRALIPLGLSWFTETDISVGEDNELLELMKASGCKQVLIGIESPQKDSLNGIEIKSNFKERVFYKNKNLIQNIQAHGITVNGCFILGLDGHKKDIFQEIYNYVESTYLYECQITVLTAFPGTPLYLRLKKENRILEDKSWHKATLFDVNFIPTHMSPQDLREGLYWLTEKLYRPSFVKQRRKRFFKNRIIKEKVYESENVF